MPLTKILLKIFAYRFYKEHSGLLFFFFVTILNYCFFIKTAGVYLEQESVFYHLILMMSFITTPLIMLMVFLFFLLYTLKSWQYVARQLQQQNNQFLFYSLTSLTKKDQLIAWFCVQLVISLPFIGYWIFAAVLGIIYHANLIPAITLFYLLSLAVLSSFLYVSWVNRISKTANTSVLIKLSSTWAKPYSSLFIYHVFDQLKIIYLFTKAFSWLIITGLLAVFANQAADMRVSAMIMLAVVTLHSFLIFREQEFKEKYLSFSRNLPFSRFKLFLNFTWVYVFLLLPEALLIFSRFSIIEAVKMLLFGWSLALLFRSIVYITSLKIYRYLLWIFGLFIFLFYMIICGQFWTLLTVSLVSGYFVFYFSYYRVKPVV